MSNAWFQAQWTHPVTGATVYGDIVERRDKCERQAGLGVTITEAPRAKGDCQADFIRQGILHTPTPRGERR